MSIELHPSPTSTAPTVAASSGHVRNPVTAAEAQIAILAFDLMVTAMTARAGNVLAAFQALPLIPEFIVDIVLGTDLHVHALW